MTIPQFDVVALGEPLIEFTSTGPLAAGAPCRLDVSGDVINMATAAAAAGAKVAVVARVSDDQLGQAILDRLTELRVCTDYVRRIPGSQGIYVHHSDPAGERQFSYARTNSVGSTLTVTDLPEGLLETAHVTVANGIAGAISASARATLLAAARRSPRFIYDPNFRPRLTSAAQARALLHEVAPLAKVITPSSPSEIEALLGVDSPELAASLLRQLGAAAVAVTCGAAGVFLHGEETSWQPALPAPAVVDQTGAGDVFVGTLAARLALGDPFAAAALYGAAAASLAVGGHGGSGGIQPFAQVLAHAENHRDTP